MCRSIFYPVGRSDIAPLIHGKAESSRGEKRQACGEKWRDSGLFRGEKRRIY